MRLTDTIIVFTALIIFAVIFSAATIFAMRMDFSTNIFSQQEVIFIYSPWQDQNQRMRELDKVGASLVSSNPSDTAWLVKVPTAKAGSTIIKNSALLALHPSKLAITLAGCGSVPRSQDFGEIHQKEK